MGILLTIQEGDETKIQNLKKELQAKTKIEVVRAALAALERELLQKKLEKKWTHVAKLVSKTSKEVNLEFQSHSRLKKS